MDRRADQAVTRMAIGLGMQVREERLRRRLTLAQVGERAGLSTAAMHSVESGRPPALGSSARIAPALSLRRGSSSALGVVRTRP
jgi:transcriptional regulator with XRE-family HTH domain